MNIVTGAVIGLIYGWGLGWSLFDPDAGVWAITAMIGSVTGSIVGRSSAFEYMIVPLSASAIFLYLGWGLAAFLFGEHFGGIGMLLVLGGAFIGWKIGNAKWITDSETALGSLLGILHAGFGGGIMAMVVYILIYGFAPYSLISIIPVVLVCGGLGGIVGGRLAKSTA